MKKPVLSITLFLSIQLVYGQEVFMKSGNAIHGYDPVAYFQDSKPVKGKNEFSYDWKGARWKFSTVENLDKF
jgi:hypothetical protein